MIRALPKPKQRVHFIFIVCLRRTRAQMVNSLSNVRRSGTRTREIFAEIMTQSEEIQFCYSYVMNGRHSAEKHPFSVHASFPPFESTIQSILVLPRNRRLPPNWSILRHIHRSAEKLVRGLSQLISPRPMPHMYMYDIW